jgi:peptide/nickel transport system substrate-binding protein
MAEETDDQASSIDFQDPVNRRKFLAAGGSATALALAGCGGDGGGDGETPTETGTPTDTDGTAEPTDTGTQTEQPPQNVDQTFTAAMGTPGSDIQFNFYGTNRNTTVESFMRDPIALQNPLTEEWYPILAEDTWIERDGDVYRIGATLKEGLTWHNGDDLTAQDVVDNYRLEQLEWYPSQEVITGAEVMGPREFEFTATVASRSGDRHAAGIFGSLDRWGHPKYEEALQALEDVGADWNQQMGSATSTEVQETAAEALDFTIPIDEVSQVGYSVFQPTDFTTQRVQFEVFEEHPLSERVNFTSVETRHLPENQSIASALQAERLTTNSGNWNQTVTSSLPESYKKYRPPAFSDTSLRFNPTDSNVGNINVRRALAHLIDTERLAQLQNQIHIEKPTVFYGSGSDRPSRELGDWWDAHASYSDTERATELLEQEGYTKEGGKWKTPEGDNFTIQILASTGDYQVVQGLSVVSDMWSGAGINTSVFTVDGATFNDRYNRFDYNVAYAPRGVIRGFRIIDAVWLLYQGSTFPSLESATHQDLVNMSTEELVEANDPGGWWEHPFQGPITEYAMPIASAPSSAWVWYAWKVPLPPEGFPKRDFFANSDFWSAGDGEVWVPLDLMKAGGPDLWQQVDDNAGMPWDANFRASTGAAKEEQILWMNWGYNHLLQRYQLYEDTADLFIQQNGWQNVPENLGEIVDNNWRWTDEFLAKHVLEADGGD